LQQTAQIKPFGQRHSNKNAAQIASSGKAFWNWVSDRALGHWVSPLRLSLLVVQAG
jgi:hypothetical protein